MSQLGVLYQYEMKKILKKKMTWISFCGVVLVMAFCCFGVLLNRYVLTDAQTGRACTTAPMREPWIGRQGGEI